MQAEKAQLAAEKAAARLPLASHAKQRSRMATRGQLVVEIQGSRTLQHKFAQRPDPARSAASAL